MPDQNLVEVFSVPALPVILESAHFELTAGIPGVKPVRARAYHVLTEKVGSRFGVRTIGQLPVQIGQRLA